MIPRAHTVEVMLDTDLATAQKELIASVGVLEWQGDGVLLRAQADDLNWIARELSRLPFDFSVRAPAALRHSLTRLARRLQGIAGGQAN